MRRLAALAVLAALGAAACGGSDPEVRPAAPPVQAGGAAQAAVPEPAGPTPAQLAERERILREIAAGELECYCTAAERARDRISSGKVRKPRADEYVSALP